MIRPAVSQDIEALAVLERDCFRGIYAEHRWSQEQVAHQLANPQNIALVAEQGRQIVGYIAGISSTGKRAHIARVYSVAVSPSARRKGVGRALVDRFVKEARLRDKRKVFLEVARERRGARRLFEQAGFSIQDELPDYYGPQHDGLRMLRVFPPPRENNEH